MSYVARTFSVGGATSLFMGGLSLLIRCLVMLRRVLAGAGIVTLGLLLYFLGYA